MFGSEELAGTTNSSMDFIHHEESFVLSTQSEHLFEVVIGWENDACTNLNRF
jgi:hypothetical protein